MNKKLNVSPETNQGKNDILPHLLQAKRMRRVFATIIDMFIVTFTSMILSAVVAIPLTGFNEMNNQAFVEFNEMRVLFETTKL